MYTFGKRAAGDQRLDSAIDSQGRSQESSFDEIRIVLDAATDFGDAAAIEACRRVIDANGKGVPAAPPDLQLIQHYFR